MAPASPIRVLRLWRAFRASLLFIPTWMTIGAVILFAMTSILDSTLWSDPEEARFRGTTLGFLVFGGTANAAESILSQVAGSWATILGVAYSVTLVTLQLSATKYSAQVIPAFEQDRFNQFVLGAFASTVVYALLVLKTVRGGSADGSDAFVPIIGVNVALVFAIVSLFLFLWFIGNLTSYIRPTQFVDDLSSKAIAALPVMRRPHHVDGYEAVEGDGSEPGDEAWTTVKVATHQDGYLVNVDWRKLRKALAELTEREPDALPRRIRVHVEPGTRVSAEDTLVTLEGPNVILDETFAKRLQSIFEISESRTVRDDPLYAIESLGDIGITSLSGGATDVGVAKVSVQAVFRIVAADFKEPPVRKAFRLHVVGDRTVTFVRQEVAPHTVGFLEVKRILDKAYRNGYWDVGDTVTTYVKGVFTRAAASEETGHWEDTMRWFEPTLAQLLTYEDQEAVGRMVQRLNEVRGALEDDGYTTEAAAFGRALRAQAARVDAGAT